MTIPKFNLNDLKLFRDFLMSLLLTIVLSATEKMFNTQMSIYYKSGCL